MEQRAATARAASGAYVGGSFPGPDRLGRGGVVAAGDPVTGPAASWPRVRVDETVVAAGVEAEAVAALRAAWARRERVLVELALAPEALKEPETCALAPYELDASFGFVREQLRFLVWANTYDLRGEAPVWWHGELAHRHLALARSDTADVCVPGAGDVWVDGGPRTGADPTLLHRESVEAGVPTLGSAGAPGEDLAPDQLAAVAHDAGPARVIAPAGSGKTRVLAARLRHLLADRGVEPSLVTALAYNTRAAAELRARTVDVDADVRTLHALGYALVREHRGAVEVLDERTVRDLVGSLARLTPKPNTDVCAPYLEALAEVRLGLRPPEEVEAARHDVDGFADFFGRYRAELRRRCAIDFDEQIYAALEALLADAGLRASTQRRCRHLLVDEFQDLTPAYLLLLRLVAAPAWQVFGVGDDDQTIYGYSGADPAHLIDYARYFPHSGQYALEVNYRCPPDVVVAADALLANNRRRVVKTIRPGRDPGEAAGLAVHRADVAELAALAGRLVGGRLDAGAAPADVAVLARVNVMLLPVQVALLAAGVPVVSRIGAELLERSGVTATLAWLRCAMARGRMDGDEVAEALRRSARKIRGATLRRIGGGPWTARQLTSLAFDELSVWEGKELRGWLDDVAVVRAAARASTAAGLAAIADTGLGDALDELDASGGDAKRGASHHDDLEALSQVAHLQPDAGQFEAWLRGMLAKAPSDRDGVQLETVHRAKGCEFDHVVVYAANAGLMPHRLAGGRDDVEEERRVFHVALTRCRTSVDIVADRDAPSPYLAELSPA